MIFQSRWDVGRWNSSIRPLRRRGWRAAAAPAMPRPWHQFGGNIQTCRRARLWTNECFARALASPQCGRCTMRCRRSRNGLAEHATSLSSRRRLQPARSTIGIWLFCGDGIPIASIETRRSGTPRGGTPRDRDGRIASAGELTSKTPASEPHTTSASVTEVAIRGIYSTLRAERSSRPRRRIRPHSSFSCGARGRCRAAGRSRAMRRDRPAGPDGWRSWHPRTFSHARRAGPEWAWT